MHFRRAPPEGAAIPGPRRIRAYIHDFQAPWSPYKELMARLFVLTPLKDPDPSLATTASVSLKISIPHLCGHGPAHVVVNV